MDLMDLSQWHGQRHVEGTISRWGALMPRDKTPPSFPFFVDDFVSDGVVDAMTTEEVGAYILLLCKAWREDPPGSIPNNDCALARWTRLSPDRWQACKPGVLAAFSFGTDDRWHQKRMRKEYAKLADSAKQRSLLAKRAAAIRWGGELCPPHAARIADALQTQCPPDASALRDVLLPPEPQKEGLKCAQIPDSLKGEEFEQVWKEWLKFRKKRRWSVDPETCLSRQLKALAEVTVAEAIECLETSMRNGWQGIFTNKSNQHGNGKRDSARVGPGQRYRQVSG